MRVKDTISSFPNFYICSARATASACEVTLDHVLRHSTASIGGRLKEIKTTLREMAEAMRKYREMWEGEKINQELHEKKCGGSR